MPWYLITTKNKTQSPKSRAFRELKKNKILTVTNTKDSFYTKVNESENGWLNSILEDFSGSYYEVDEPSYFIAACGQATVSRQHSSRCNSCKRLKSNSDNTNKALAVTRIPVSKTLFKLPGLELFNLDGLEILLDTFNEEALQLSIRFDDIKKSIQSIKNVKEQLDELKTKEEEAKKALRVFLADSKIEL
jgi:hypothetical protein